MVEIRTIKMFSFLQMKSQKRNVSLKKLLLFLFRALAQYTLSIAQ